MHKEKYNEFIKHTYVPIFSQPWWLDANVGADNWDVYVVERSGSYLAACPYYFEMQNGKKVITKAKNTQNNGIIFNYPTNQGQVSRLNFEERIINEICDHIESLCLAKYEQQYHYSFINWLPFYWRGYSEVTRYTYVIDDAADYSTVYARFNGNVRKQCKKASGLVILKECLSPEDFFKINEMSFTRQGKDIPYSFEWFERIHTICHNKNAGKMIMAIDKTDESIHSVVFLVWDTQSMYYLLSGTDPEKKSSQANFFLINEAIKMAGYMSLKFDFEGSVIQPIEKAFRQFGGEMKRYFRISKIYER